MQASDIPTKQPTPWATSAGGSFIRNIPIPSQIGIQAGAASYTDGFPPVTFDPIGAGGTPPFGQDFNGIFNACTKWLRWVQAGGGVGFYDGAFAAAIGGYPSGAMLQSSTQPGTFWISTTDNNVNNPDTTPAGWLSFPGTSIIPPGRVVTASSAVTIDCDTDYAVFFNRTSAVAPTAVSVAGAGTLKNFQPFEIWDSAYNFDQFPLTLTLPGGHTFPNGQNTMVLNQAGQGVMLKYSNSGTGGNKWGVR